MASAAELQIQITAKDEASKVFKQAEKSAGGFGKALMDVSKIAAGFAIGTALTKLPQLFNGPIKAASDLGESMNAVQVVFGKASDKLVDFGKISATQVGLSARAFNQLATPLGAMLKNYGMGTSEAAVQTIELTKRASDMASVFNTSVEDALGAVTAALRGETDPIERYGVSVNAAKVEVAALAATGKKSAKDLTDQEKATARLKLIMQQTSAVAGDFVNTSDGLANKQRIIAARTEEVSAQLGEKLMPVMLKFKEIQLAVVETLTTKFIPVLQQVITYITPFAEAIGAKLTAGFQTLMAQGPAVVAAFESIRQPVQRLVDLFKLGFNGGQIGGELGTMQTAAFQVGNFFREVVIPAFNDAKNAIHLFFLALQGGNAGGELTTLQQKALALGASIRTMWQQDIQPAMRAFADIVVTTVKAINDNWGTIGPVLEKAVQLVIASIEGMLTAFRGVVEVISGVIQTVKNIMHGDWEAAWTSAGDVVNGAIKLITGVLDAFSRGAFSMLVQAGKDVIGGLLSGMKEKFKEVKDWLSGAANSVKDTVAGALGIKSPSTVMKKVGEDTMQGFINGLTAKFGDAKGVLNQLAKMMQSGTAPGTFIAKGTGAYGSQINALQALLGGIGEDTAGEIWRRLQGEADAAAEGLAAFKKGLPVSTDWINTYGKATKGATGNVEALASAVGGATESLKNFGVPLDAFGRVRDAGTSDVLDAFGRNVMDGGSSSSAGGDFATRHPQGGSSSRAGGNPNSIWAEIAAMLNGSWVSWLAGQPNGLNYAITGRSLPAYNAAGGGDNSTAAAPASVTVNVQGSVLSERDLLEVVRNGMAAGALRGVIA